MDEVHRVDALQMDASLAEGRSAFQMGMTEQMQHHELDRSIQRIERKNGKNKERDGGEENLSKWK